MMITIFIDNDQYTGTAKYTHSHGCANRYDESKDIPSRPRNPTNQTISLRVINIQEIEWIDVMSFCYYFVTVLCSRNCINEIHEDMGIVFFINSIFYNFYEFVELILRFVKQITCRYIVDCPKRGYKTFSTRYLWCDFELF